MRQYFIPSGWTLSVPRNGEADEPLTLRTLADLAREIDVLGDIEIIQLEVRIGPDRSVASLIYCDGPSWREKLLPAAKERLRGAIQNGQWSPQQWQVGPAPLERPDRDTPSAVTEFAIADNGAGCVPEAIQAATALLSALRPASILGLELRTGSRTATVSIRHLPQST